MGADVDRRVPGSNKGEIEIRANCGRASLRHVRALTHFTAKFKYRALDDKGVRQSIVPELAQCGLIKLRCHVGL